MQHPKKQAAHLAPADSLWRYNGPAVATVNVFIFLFGAHLAAAVYAPIQDCDEVFNFWEPTHYLNHGYGMQTWELSPVYAIRSWAYVSLHALLISALSWLPAIASKTAEFYALRIAFAVICAICETRLFSVISACLNSRVALLFVLVTASSAGSFIAATSYLPSSFAMYTIALAMASFADRRFDFKTTQGLVWLAVGTILGWPFVAVICLPFVLEDAVASLSSGSTVAFIRRMISGLAFSVLILVGEVGVDSLFYRKLDSPPLRIVLYNVLSGEGPDIYGTEPWHFYTRNLLINFNFWFLLALAAAPLLLLRSFLSVKSLGSMSLTRTLVLTSPLYLWLAVMTAQAHKEERFMYPIYPSLALNAAISSHIIIAGIGSSNPKRIISQIPAKLRLLFVVSLLALFCALGIWRSAGLATAYAAPLHIYTHLSQPTSSHSKTTICLGKEWYRFPASYHLPSTHRLAFIPSAFHGLLPGPFAEPSPSSRTVNILTNRPGTWLIPDGMNDRNAEDPGKYSDISVCDYLVDSRFASTPASADEPDYIGASAQATSDWERVACEPFLDAGATGTLGRLFWTPDAAWVPRPLRRSWGEYCLLKRRVT